jgi:hypothetical protein
MSPSISQADAIEMFDLPTDMLYVCDGKRECGSPTCLDYSRTDVCHHTTDYSHALYDVHYTNYFERHQAVRDGEAAIICVEPIRG